MTHTPYNPERHDFSDEAESSCDALQPGLAALALGEPTEDPELAAHLRACPACQRELGSYVQVARVLPYDAPLHDPSPALRERIVTAVARASMPPTAVPRAQRRWSWSLPALGLAMIALVALLAWNVTLQQQLATQSAQINVSREGWRTMTALLNDPNVQWYALAGDAGSGHFWASEQQQVGCLVVEGLPQLASNQVYQVWLNDGSTRESGGTFVARNGSAWLLIPFDEPLTAYQSVGVTVEPDGGSPAPTGPRVLFGPLTHT